MIHLHASQWIWGSIEFILAWWATEIILSLQKPTKSHSPALGVDSWPN